MLGGEQCFHYGSFCQQIGSLLHQGKIIFGSFHAKRPEPSSLTLFKFVQNVL